LALQQEAGAAAACRDRGGLSATDCDWRPLLLPVPRPKLTASVRRTLPVVTLWRVRVEGEGIGELRMCCGHVRRSCTGSTVSEIRGKVR